MIIKTKLQSAREYHEQCRLDPQSSEWETMYAATLYQIALLERLVDVTEHSAAEPSQRTVTISEDASSVTYGFVFSK